jgi:hypothetical protein
MTATCPKCGQVEVPVRQQPWQERASLASHNAPPNADGYVARCGNRQPVLKAQRPRWAGEVGAPPRGLSHAIVGYFENRLAVGACGTRFRLQDNHYSERGEPLERDLCPACRRRIEGGSVEDAR